MRFSRFLGLWVVGVFVCLFVCFFTFLVPCGAGDESRQMPSNRCYRTYLSICVLSYISKWYQTEVWALQILSISQDEQCPSYALDFRPGWGCCNNSGRNAFAKTCCNASCKDSPELDRSEELRPVNLQEAA